MKIALIRAGLRIFAMALTAFAILSVIQVQAATQTKSSQTPDKINNEQLVTEVVARSPTIGLGKLALDDLRSFVEVFDLLRAEQVAELDDKLLFDAAILGMLQNADPNAMLYSKTGYQELLEFTEGGLADIGVSVKYNQEGQWQILEVSANSPAKSKGISKGDVLVKIDGKSLTEYRLAIETPAVEQLFWGEDGSWVSLTYTNASGKTDSVRIQRKKLVDDELTFTQKDGILIAHIPSFTETTVTQLGERLQSFSGRGLLLDLRSNPGGLLTSAVDVAGLFLENQPVVELRYRGGKTEMINTRAGATYSELPLLLLVDKYTASAAEVLAVALSESGRAVIAGDVTYGKGSVQKVWPLYDGRAVKFTVAYYYSPKGQKIDGRGISPTYASALFPVEKTHANAANSKQPVNLSGQQEDSWIKGSLDYFK